MDAYGDYASGSYRARALQTGNFAHKKQHGVQGVKQMLSEVSATIHYAKRRASQVIFSGAAEMTVEARLQEEFRSYMINNPLEDDPSVQPTAAYSMPAPVTRMEADPSYTTDADEVEEQQHAMHKRMAAHQMKGMKGRRQSFVMGTDGSSAANLLGQLRGLKDYSPASTETNQPKHQHQEKKVLASSAKSNPALSKLMRKSRLLGDLDASSSDEDLDEDMVPTHSKPRQGKSASNPQIPARSPGAASPRSPGSPGLPHPSLSARQFESESDIHSQAKAAAAPAAPPVPHLGGRAGRRMSVVLANIPAGTQSAPCTSRIRPLPPDATKPQTAQPPGRDSEDLSSALGLPAPSAPALTARRGRRGSTVMTAEHDDDASYGSTGPPTPRAPSGAGAASMHSRRGSINNLPAASAPAGLSLTTMPRLGRQPSSSHGSLASLHALGLSSSRREGADLDASHHSGGNPRGEAAPRPSVPAPVWSVRQARDDDAAAAAAAAAGANGFLSKMKGWITRR